MLARAVTRQSSTRLACVISPELELARPRCAALAQRLAPARAAARARASRAGRSSSSTARQTVIKLVIAGTGARGSIDPVPAARRQPRKRSRPMPSSSASASVIVVERELIAQLSSEIESALRLDQDGVAQALVALRALKQPCRPRAVDRAAAARSAARARVRADPAHVRSARARSQRARRVRDRGRSLARPHVDHRGQGRRRHHARGEPPRDRGPRARGHARARLGSKGYKRVLEAVEERFAKPSLGAVPRARDADRRSSPARATSSRASSTPSAS